MKISFIGAGNMGGAILNAIIKTELFKAEEIIVNTKTKASLKKYKEKYNVNTTLETKEAIEKSDYVILAVKPDILRKNISKWNKYVNNKQIIISVAAGVTLKELEEALGCDKKIVRAMPNTPAMVLEAMSSLSTNSNINEEEVEKILKIFNSFGKAEVVDESLIDAVIGVSGSSPAYVFMFIESMADAAVSAGMPRKQAYKFAAQAVIGSAKMVLETGMHPGELKDMVCSPGGTTIKAVASLEEHGFRNAIIKSIDACVEKSKELSE